MFCILKKIRTYVRPILFECVYLIMKIEIFFKPKKKMGFGYLLINAKKSLRSVTYIKKKNSGVNI